VRIETTKMFPAASATSPAWRQRGRESACVFLESTDAKKLGVV
jgi:hypothetical protein